MLLQRSLSMTGITARLVLVLGLAALTIVWGCGADNTVPLYPLSVFFMNPDVISYQLSPDGRHVAFLKQWEFRLNIFVQQIDGGEARRITAATERDINQYTWAGNAGLVYLQDRVGDGNVHLHAVDLAGGQPHDLTPYAGVRVQVLSTLPLDHDHIVIAMNQRAPHLMDCYRIDVHTGELELAAENPGDVAAWYADHDGRVRAALSISEGINRIIWRETEDTPWEEVARGKLPDLLQPQYFTFDGQYLYVKSSHGRDTEGLYKFDPRKREFVELLFAHPEVDIAFLFNSYKKRLLRGLAFQHEKIGYHFFDEEGLGIHHDIEARLPDVIPWVVSLSDDESRMIVVTITDRSRGAYYLLDRPHDELRKLADVSPWIDEQHMAAMEPVHFTARDGQVIHAYLTLPAGQKARDLPLVVTPCPSPWQRFLWGYQPSTQFLANRGYAVLRVNPRGTEGYGKQYVQAGFREWGGTILDDLQDGVDWLVEQGIVDPQRVGVTGHSVGGFVALASAMKKPQTYRCAISTSGPVCLAAMLESPPPYWYTTRDILHAMFGDPADSTDRAAMRATAPRGNAERFSVPLLLAQGVNDPVSSVAMTDSFVADLKALGKDVQYLRVGGEGHEFSNTENRYELFSQAAAFLAKHLGGRLEPGS